MAVPWTWIGMMEKLQLLRPGVRILDIGSSNLYSAPADGIRDFLGRHNPSLPAGEAGRLAERLAAGSYVDPVKGALNGAFVGQLFEAAGMEYLSFDIASGYKTETFDFNVRSLPDRYRNAFDLVLNFGTTEHVLNQYNCFKVIHEATRPGGIIWHQIPTLGFVDHCYFTYKPRFFFELAGYNGYELVAYWYSVGGQSRLMDTVKDYADHFPVLRAFAADPMSSPQPAEDFQVTNACATAIYRKTKDAPFMGTIERSTSVGNVPDSVMESYTTPATGRPAEAATTPALVTRAWRAVRRGLRPVRRLVRGG